VDSKEALKAKYKVKYKVKSNKEVDRVNKLYKVKVKAKESHNKVKEVEVVIIVICLDIGKLFIYFIVIQGSPLQRGTPIPNRGGKLL
jgi:hypothetical protein